MANDCWNKVVIKGDEVTLKKIEEKFNSVENGFFNFSNYHLLFDTDVSDMVEDDFGSKRFAVSVTMEDGKLHVSGDSAWSPMIGLFERICVDYSVEAELKYEERGYDYAGHIEWDSKGVEVSHHQWTYWEMLYLTDQYGFWEEMEWRYEIYESYDELIADFNLDEWKDSTILDQERLKTEFEDYLEENS